MNAGTAYLLLCVFAALVALTVVEPAVEFIGDSLNDSAAAIHRAYSR